MGNGPILLSPFRNSLWHHCLVSLLTCRKMNAADVRDAFEMLADFLGSDEHYLASSQAYGDLGLKGLNDALDLFFERPELGFVWMAFDEKGAAGICVVCYAISTSMGSVVAKLDDVSVKHDRRGQGVGTELLEQLKEQLRKEAVTRIDVAVHLENPAARRFYEKAGFLRLNEERLSCVL
jgi:ribosomal protein S18 acetylase RimI-like enzyme